MKRILFFGLLLFGATKSYTQEKPLAKVHYNFKHINDTTQRDKFIKDEVVTYLGEGGSYYASYSGTRMQEDMKKQMDDPAFDGSLIILKRTSPISETYIIEPAQQKMTEIVKVASDEFVLSGVYPEQDWEILEETKDIGGYSCQKATTDFKGRHYMVWFTTEIPLSAGPWKLHGLPGLILSAKDSTGEVEFEYAGFDKIEGETGIRIAPSEMAIASTASEVEKLQKAFRANPSAYMSARSSGATAASTGVGGRSSSGNLNSSPASDMSKVKAVHVKNDDSYVPSKITNNPIELIP
ncbi:MAG: GLPGLI family protein [Sphingobacterium sp.]|jgi:GLPGLI family protein|nr:GLPGLI family protein [Sphingobacterium sp.]